MANSKYEYVRQYEQTDEILPNTWIVVRIDGRGFHRFSKAYDFSKPNDINALKLMNEAAVSVFNIVPDVCIAYGHSDEYSFVLRKTTTLFERRASKLVSTIVSSFTASYVHLWSSSFPLTPLVAEHLPTFDGRAIAYPSLRNLRDYLSWRQADCHVNNLYNTTFWALVDKGGLDNVEAERQLSGTVSADKNEILFSRFGINYNNEPQICRKGSVVFRDVGACDSPLYRRRSEVADGKGQLYTSSNAITGDASTETYPSPPPVSRTLDRRKAHIEVDDGDTGLQEQVSKTQLEKKKRLRQKAKVEVDHVDIIGDGFWTGHSWILER